MKKIILFFLPIGLVFFSGGCTAPKENQSLSRAEESTQLDADQEDIDALGLIRSPKHLPPVRSADLNLLSFKASEIEKDGLKFIYIDASTGDNEDFFVYEACSSETNQCITGEFQDSENLISLPTSKVLKLRVKGCVEDIRKVDEACGAWSQTFVQKSENISSDLFKNYKALYSKEEEIVKIVSSLNEVYQDYLKNNQQALLPENQQDPFFKSVLGAVEIGPHTYEKILSGDDFKHYQELQGYKTFVCQKTNVTPKSSPTNDSLGLAETAAVASDSIAPQAQSSSIEGYARAAAAIAGVSLLAYGIYKIVPNWSDKPIYAAYGATKELFDAFEEASKLPTNEKKRTRLLELVEGATEKEKLAAFKKKYNIDAHKISISETLFKGEHEKVTGEFKKRDASWKRILNDHANSTKKARLEVVDGKLKVKDAKLAANLEESTGRIIVERAADGKPAKYLDQLEKGQKKFLNSLEGEAKSDLKALTSKKRVDGKTAVIIGALAIGTALTIFIAQDTLLKLADDDAAMQSRQEVLRKSSEIHKKLETLLWERDSLVCDINSLR